MDVVTGSKYQREIREDIEKELGRKLTESELEVFYKASRMGLVKGYVYGQSCYISRLNKNWILWRMIIW